MMSNEEYHQIMEEYESNKQELKHIRHYIHENGCLDNGLSDASESFEQGFNNGIEFVFKILGIPMESKADLCLRRRNL